MIIAMVRTRDEEKYIGAFCEAYQDVADKILVADGGSEDDTVKIASSFSNVEIRYFWERRKLENGYWRNNDSDHINFLIDWAKEYDPEWIILDDCDSRPNKLLRENARGAFAEAGERNVVMVVRVYLWEEGQHFPNMMKLKPVENFNYMTSLWAWRPDADLHTVEAGPAYTLMIDDRIAGNLHETANVLDLMPPYCLLHYTWESEAQTLRRIKVYKESGLIPTHKHPLQYAGPLEPIPEWARE